MFYGYFSLQSWLICVYVTMLNTGTRILGKLLQTSHIPQICLVQLYIFLKIFSSLEIIHISLWFVECRYMRSDLNKLLHSRAMTPHKTQPAALSRPADLLSFNQNSTWKAHNFGIPSRGVLAARWINVANCYCGESCYQLLDGNSQQPPTSTSGDIQDKSSNISA